MNDKDKYTVCLCLVVVHILLSVGTRIESFLFDLGSRDLNNKLS